MLQGRIVIRVILLMSILGLCISVAFDLGLIKFAAIMYILSAVFALSIMLDLRLFIDTHKSNIYETIRSDTRRKIKNGVNTILAFNILAEATIILMIVNIIDTSRASFLVLFMMMTTAFSIRLTVLKSALNNSDESSR